MRLLGGGLGVAGAPGIFGAVFTFGVAGAAEVAFSIFGSNGSLLAKRANSVSCPGSGVGCTDATMFVRGVPDA